MSPEHSVASRSYGDLREAHRRTGNVPYDCHAHPSGAIARRHCAQRHDRLDLCRLVQLITYDANMAERTVITMVDDIDGSTDDVVTCAFGLGDSHFEIDLNAAHREELESVLGKFVAAGRQIRGEKAAGQQRPAKVDRSDQQQAHAIRQWAKDNGYDVSERGRISRTLVEAFEAAH